LLIYYDCEMKITTLMQSSFGKHYEGRISQVQKEIKYVLEFFKVWKTITKFWVYLNPIFE